jgi:hypothetical protein
MSRVGHTVAVAAWTALVVGCEAPSPPTVRLDVTVLDVEDRPIAGAAVEVNGSPIGPTDDRGLSTARLKGPEGRQVSVSVTCPDGFDSKDPQPEKLIVRFLKPLQHLASDADGQVAEPFLPLRTTSRCQPQTQSFVLLVKTNDRANLPVTVHGRPVSTTDADGVAQTVIAGSPGQDIEVVLDTSGQPELRPEMPTRRLAVPDTRQIVVFEQNFKKLAPKKPRRSRKRVLGPKRI